MSAEHTRAPERAGDPALHEPHVSHLALLVRLAAADGDQHPVAVGRVGDKLAQRRTLTSLRRMPAHWYARALPRMPTYNTITCSPREGFHETIQTRAMNGVDEWGPSDHSRLLIEVGT